jgi:hypothetical protein
VLGVQGFRWFSLTVASASWWRLLLVWLAAGLAPWLVSASLFWTGFWLQGGTVTTTQVEVLDGPARRAGLRDGDRIVNVAGHRIETFDQVREHVHRQSGPVELEVLRGSQKLSFVVTPKDRKIGVAPQLAREDLSPLQAAQRALPMPGHVVRDSMIGLLRIAKGSDAPDLRGPVGIVRESSKAHGANALLTFLAVLSAYFWPFLAGIAFIDAFATALFCATHPSAPSWPPRAQRLARIQQTIVFGFAGCALALACGALAAAKASLVAPVLIFGMPLAASVYPLLWIGGAQVWRRRSVWLVVVSALFVPCVGLLALFDLHQTLRRELRREGFRVDWWRVKRAAADLRPNDSPRAPPAKP